MLKQVQHDIQLLVIPNSFRNLLNIQYFVKITNNKHRLLRLNPTKDTSSNPQNGVFMNAKASNNFKNFHLLRHRNSLQQ